MIPVAVTDFPLATLLVPNVAELTVQFTLFRSLGTTPLNLQLETLAATVPS
jgi:hypothetical protein